MCDHKNCLEKKIVRTVVQRCRACGMIREYNPRLKKVLPVTDPDLWSDWSEGHVLFDKFFADSGT